MQFKSFVFFFSFFKLFSAIFLKVNTTFKPFQRLKTLIFFHCAVSSEQKMFTSFGVLCYIANFKGAELQFSGILSDVYAKLLLDPMKMKP